MKPIRLARETIYTSEWVDLHVDRVKFPGGRIIERHHLLDFSKKGVASLVRNDANDLLLINSYRYTLDLLQWELPAGDTEVDEDPLVTAKRESLEETGYDTSEHKLIYTYYPLVGISNKVFHIVSSKVGEKKQAFDNNEVKEVRWFSCTELNYMVQKKQLTDGFSLVGILLHLQNAY